MASRDRLCAVCLCEVEDGEQFVSCSVAGPAGAGAAASASEPHAHVVHAEECFPQFMLSVSQERESVDFFEKTQSIRCPSHHDGCDGVVTLEAASRGGPVALKCFVNCSQTVACSLERRTTVAHVERESMKASAEANTNLAERMLCDVRDVLTNAISCPHCHAPFLDFSGCLALTCAGCSRGFCGVCCKVHARTADGHQAVAECVGRLSAAEKKQYDFHSTYFISSPGWKQWSERLKVAAVVAFFQTLRRDLVWDAFGHIDKGLKNEDLLGEQSRLELATKVYSHDVGAVHLVRIPITFWLLYSAKKGVTFEDAVRAVALPQEAKINLGKRILNKVQKMYPSWVKVKTPVPGESFEALNYPPEFMPLIAKEIESWGVGKYW